MFFDTKGNGIILLYWPLFPKKSCIYSLQHFSHADHWDLKKSFPWWNIYCDALTPLKLVSFASFISMQLSLLTSSTEKKGLALSVVQVFLPIPHETTSLVEKKY